MIYLLVIKKDVIVVETAYAFTEQEDDDHSNIVSNDMAIQGLPTYPQKANGPC
jgi:arabinogalactan endo-1,4-beta-galactosidase